MDGTKKIFYASMNSRNPKFNSRYFWSYRRRSWVHRQILWSMGQGGHRDSAPREIVAVLDRRRVGTVVWIPSSWRSKRTISKYKRFQWTKISIQAETDDSSRHFTYLSIYSSCHLEINSTIKSTTIVISSDFSCVKLIQCSSKVQTQLLHSYVVPYFFYPPKK